MNYEFLAILSAYGADLVIGDPQWGWHPVRMIGRLIVFLEKKMNTECHCQDPPQAETKQSFKVVSGAVFFVLVVGITVFCVWAGLQLALSINPLVYYILAAALIYFALSIKSLALEAGKVYRALTAGDIAQARKRLSMIVGRDTDNLDEPEIIRATVETVAESIMDGIVAPLFYIFLGGPVLVWAYKAINTLDSMVGYKNERFGEFGKISAKADAFVNLIPAKITCLLIGISSLFCAKDWVNSLKWSAKHLLKGPENNSIATEAAMAGALKVGLGGVNYYDSLPVSRPLIGDGSRALKVKHIRESIQIAYLASFLFLGLGLFFLLGRR